MRKTLAPTLSVEQFDNGYWFVEDLRSFARGLGIRNASRLRKNELEAAIRHYLAKSEIVPADQKLPQKTGIKDIDIGLGLDLPVRHYTSNRTTKDFIASEAKKIAPNIKPKSGARYRLNRWREDEIAAGRSISYRDVVQKYIELNQETDSFARIPHGRYINFISDFMSKEPKATHARAVRAWEEIKRMDAPKTYAAWNQRAKSR